MFLPPNPYPKRTTLLSKSLLLSASLMLPTAADAMTANTVSPESGFAETTQFTFSTTAQPASGEEVVLRLWSPNIYNQWDWLEIPMTLTDAATHTYSINKGMAEFSDAYKYQYQVKNSETGAVIESSEELYGPNLVVNTSDNRAPEVLRTFPADLSVGVNPNQQITVLFDEIIDPASVQTTDFQLSDSSNSVESVTAYQNRAILTFSEAFTQSDDFDQSNSTYSVSVSGVTDLNGNQVVPYSFDFSVNTPMFHTFKIESRKYSGNCVTVIDDKKRFADPQAWNPVVELTQCDSSNEDQTQRWFLGAEPGSGQYAQIRWAYNHHYCLSKKTASNPVLERCADGKSEQRFKLRSRYSYYLIESDHGGCLASGIVDAGSINKVESSLCTKTLKRNHWYVNSTGLRELTEPVLLGQVDIRYADIQYTNPETGVNLTQDQTRDLVKSLYATNATNQAEIYQQLQLQANNAKGEGFSTNNPYFPRYTGIDILLPKKRSVVINGVAIENYEDYENTKEGYHYNDNGLEYYSQEVVARWYSDVTWGKAAAQEVCAVKFSDDINYEMRTFASKDAAQLEGWTVTHQYKCGTCSTLKDLAVYMGVKDQTTPVRLCTKRGKADNSNLDEVKQCIQDTVGFTDMCAESWAYNGIHTGQECQETCMKTYGNDALFWPRLDAFFDMVIAEKFNACPAEVESDDPVFREQMKQSGCPLANENTGKLNDCLWCDERKSGPGFKYTAARTRRASGLESAIPRPNDTLYYQADHTEYFK